MNTFIEIVEKQKVLDDEGFSTVTDVVLASVRAYREGRHGNEKWANRHFPMPPTFSAPCHSRPDRHYGDGDYLHNSRFEITLLRM